MTVTNKGRFGWWKLVPRSWARRIWDVIQCPAEQEMEWGGLYCGRYRWHRGPHGWPKVDFR